MRIMQCILTHYADLLSQQDALPRLQANFCGSFLHFASRMRLINSWMHLAVFEWA